MGAVFGIFLGYYNFSSQVLGKNYNELLAQIHFWLTFISVNIIFAPMHWLGLNGMPRRISDYPDVYLEWNYLSSLGSSISIISVILFIYIIYDQIINENKLKKNGNYEFFNNKEKINYSLDLILKFPPNYHHFKQLPIA